MKNIFLIIVLIGFSLSFDAFSQSQSISPADQQVAQTLQELNEQNLRDLESLERFYDELSKEIIFTEILSEGILNGTAVRASCTANCGTAPSVTCSGAQCSAQDGVGCASADSSGGNVTGKFCLKLIPIK